MAKYMMTENAFLPDGQLHEASLDKPKVIVLPNTVMPSLTWIPLDMAAKRLLEALAEEKVAVAVAASDPLKVKSVEQLARRQFRIKKMPEGADTTPLSAEEEAQIVPQKVTTREDLEMAAFKKLTEKGQSQKPAEEVIVPRTQKGKRTSDQEPD